MTGRLLKAGDPIYVQTWDDDNRLKTVTVNGQTTTFTYDGKGALVKKVAGGVTTAYAGSHYEKQGGIAVKYYLFGGQRVAMNRGGVLYYLAGDHLGTTSVVLCGQAAGCGGIPLGGKVAESRHHPYGTIRWSSGTFPTDYRFTGQRVDSYIKLYAMGARQYDPELGRWISPDSIIPDPANPQSFNRYSYVYNRPLVATDPTGHDLMIVGGAGGDLDPQRWMEWIMAYTGWSLEEWTAFYDAWKAEVNFAGKNAVLAAEGIRIFAWGGSTMENAIHNARSISNEEMLDDLSNEMKDMVDITLMGWSKGGNLVMLYLQALAEGQNLVKPDHAVLIAPADTWISELRDDIPNYGTRNKIPRIGINVANVCVWWDPVCDSKPQGTINFNTGISGHGPHGQVARQVFTALSVAYDRNAWNEYGWIWATK